MFPTETADGSKTLFSTLYQQTFHSDKGALSESRHVFLEGAGVAKRLRLGLSTAVLEVGFGTGLNFFLTADLALRSGASLIYTALEQDLLDSAILAKLAYQNVLQDSSLISTYCQFREALPAKPDVGVYPFVFKGLRLELLVGEATTRDLPAGYFDAIYQDAFSPDANPELWTETFFQKLYSALKVGGTLTSYSVKGDVRRRLQALGFLVEKRPGPPGGKREMLLARK